MEKQMTRRKTQEQARAMFASRGATMVGEYVGTKTPVECVCDTCGATGWPTYGHVQGGRGACATCGYARRTKEQTKPEAEARAIAIAGGFTPDADAPYPGNGKPWKGTCNTCGETVSPTLGNVQSGNGACIHCAGQAKYTEAKARAIAIAGGFTPDVPYSGVDAPWKGTCDTCGETVSPSLGSIQRGRGACKYCGNARRAKAQTRTEAETRAIAIACGFTPSVPYSGHHTPWKGTCNTCGETVSPTLGNVQSGNGACTGCAPHGYDSTKPGHLYLMAGDSDGLPWLKVGITNNAPANRAKDVGGTIIDSVLHESGADAHRVEQEILGKLGDLRGTGIPEGGDGYTESWSAWLMPVTTLTELRERYAVAA
jgi:formylmethanofuran dehydrogenase subunit E